MWLNIDLDDFNERELIDAIVSKYKKSKKFKETLLDKIKESDQNNDFLSSLQAWENQDYARECFEALSFSHNLKQWILQTYATKE